MSELKLSIILPCYNVEKYISECLESVYTQDLATNEFEIICVDDCSIDETVPIIRGLQNVYNNITLIEHELNQKQGIARNTGLKHAKGRYVLFIDPDDRLLENSLCPVLDKAFLSDLEIVQYNVTINRSGIFTNAEKNFIHDSDILTGVDYLKSIYPENWGKECEVWRKIYKREFLVDNGITFPDIWVGEDIVFFYQSYLTCKRMQCVAQTVYEYRIDNPESTINNKQFSGRKLADRFISSIMVIDLFEKDKSLDKSLDESLKKEWIGTYVWSLRQFLKSILKSQIKEQISFHKNINDRNIEILKNYSPLLYVVISMSFVYYTYCMLYAPIKFTRKYLRYIVKK